jgi:hypothetical protein
MATFRSITNRTEVVAAFEKVVGEECWSIIAGPGTGGVILLDLGPKLPREHELHNDTLTDEERMFESAYSIHVWCSWRVEQAGVVVGSWVALPEDGWWDRSGLARIKGRQMTGFDLVAPIPDLRMNFGDICLRTFADTLSVNEDDCAFTLRTPTEVLLVFSNGELQREWVEL